jgi:serine/threonine protein kinase
MKLEKIGRYTIVAKLGTGAMGVVYKGYDEMIKRNVAIKMIYLEKFLNEEQLEEVRKRFYRECRAAGNLSHPHIVTIYDVGEYKDQPFIAMEYIDGENLVQKIKKYKVGLPWKFVVDIFIQVAKGLEYAHKKGIIHRDIKPANILVDRENQAKIADFGIAKISFSKMTKTGLILGTPSYMAPEQIRDGKTDKRSDIFSLGASLYQAVTGAKPFTGKDISEVMRKVIQYDPPIITLFPQVVPAAIERIIKKAIQKDPAQRYQNCSEIYEDLMQLKKKASKEKDQIENSATIHEKKYARVKETHFSNIRIALFFKNLNLYLKDKLFHLKRAIFPEVPNTNTIINRLAKKNKLLWYVISSITLIVLIAIVSTVFLFPQKHDKELEASRKVEQKDKKSALILKETIGKGSKKDNKLSNSSKSALFDNTEQGGKNVLKKDIFVVTSPAGASIIKNNKDTNLITPAALEVKGKEGEKVVITLKKRGYQDVIEHIEIRDNANAELNFNLQPIIKRMVLNSSPQDAKVYVNGKEMSALTPTVLELAGDKEYRIKLEKSGYYANQFTIDAASAKDKVAITLEKLPSPGIIVISSFYTYDAYIDEKLIANSEKTGSLGIAPGSHKIRLINKDLFVDKTFLITVSAGDTINIDAPPLGKISIQAEPSSCKIYIDEQFAGYPPIFEQLIAAGEHRIKFEWTTFNIEKEKAIVVNKDQVTYLYENMK